MTERLTNKTDEGIWVKESHVENVMKTLYQCYGAEPLPNYSNCDEGYCGMEKLAEYETAEEEGRLVVLPSKQVWESQGDIVYYIYDYEITECVNCGISICADGKAWIGLAADENIFPYREPIAEFDTDPTDWCKKTTDVLALEWGKTVFLTREEAEKALREMEGK